MAANLGPLVLLMLLRQATSPSGPTAPAPGPSPALPPAPGPPPPTPSDVVVPPAPAPDEPTTPKKLKAVEVWHVDAAKVTPNVVGALNPQQESLLIDQLQTTFPLGWTPLPQGAVTSNEAELARRLTGPDWRNGGLLFAGPKTIAGRRCFRMTEHTRKGQTPSPAPPAPGPSPAPPAPGPSPAPPAPGPAPAPSTVLQTTRVRKGEGLANIARRLGRPPEEDGISIIQIVDANVPDGPNGTHWQKAKLRDGAIKKATRSRPGLIPGDVLFVPAEWGHFDATQL